jgi:hypothetical protein
MKRRTLLGMLTGLATAAATLGFFKGRKMVPFAGLDVADGADHTVIMVHPREAMSVQHAVWHGSFEERIAAIQKLGFTERYDSEWHGPGDSFAVVLLTRQTVLGDGEVADAYISDARVLRAQAMRAFPAAYSNSFPQDYTPLPAVTVWRLDSDCIAVTHTSLSEASIQQLCESINAQLNGRATQMTLKPTHFVFPA